MFFFFQAEDGIRDKLVTGVQTCALPISAGCVVTASWMFGSNGTPVWSMRVTPALSSSFQTLRSTRSTPRSEEHTSELQSLAYLVCRLLLEKKKCDHPAGRPLPPDSRPRHHH